MAKPEWGSKRTCQSCATVYYDFKRDPIVCPSCGTTFQPELPAKARRSRSEAKPKAPAKPPVAAKAKVDTDAGEADEGLLLDDTDAKDETDSDADEVDTSLVDSDEIDVDLDNDDDDTVLAADDDDEEGDDVQGIVDPDVTADDELTK